MTMEHSAETEYNTNRIIEKLSKLLTISR